jgi:hypothetical protein
MGELGQLFSRDTQAIFFNWKEKPVQRMLDFDFLCGAHALASASCYLGSSLTPMWHLGRPQDALSGLHRAARLQWRLPKGLLWGPGDCHPHVWQVGSISSRTWSAESHLPVCGGLSAVRHSLRPRPLC